MKRNGVECLTVYYNDKMKGHHIKVIRGNSVRRYRYTVARTNKLHAVTLAQGWHSVSKVFIDNSYAIDVYPPDHWDEIAQFVS